LQNKTKKLTSTFGAKLAIIADSFIVKALGNIFLDTPTQDKTSKHKTNEQN